MQDNAFVAEGEWSERKTVFPAIMCIAEAAEGL